MMLAAAWTQRTVREQNSPGFLRSLLLHYEPVAEFEPTIAFRFDPFAWRMDYDALAKVVPGESGIGGPALTIYRRANR